jgi:simple sugar transport system permease protein
LSGAAPPPGDNPPERPPPEPAPTEIPPAVDPTTAAPATVASRFDAYQRAGGLVVPVLTAVLAFLIGGLVVLATGHNPISAYVGIFEGAGLNWIFEIPWDTSSVSGTSLQQTLILTTTLILTGLAVAFAFRCGLFNIGGQGQYIVGVIVANWVGVSFVDMSRPLHVVIGIVAATLAGAAWAGIAGFLKATVGAHEVITTIMLNWIAIWVGIYLFGQGGPLQGPVPSNPISAEIADSAKLPVFWGSAALQGLHVGIFIALGALVVFWLILNRTTLGYEVRAVGFNPDAAAYGGISVARSYFLAMAISGAFAGLAGGLDMLGYLHQVDVLTIQTSTIGFLGIAVALLGRNTAVGVLLASLLFGALLFGTTRGLDPRTFDPQLASNLTLIIQGLIVLFVGADLLILSVWRKRPRLRRRKGEPAAAEATT